MKEWTANHSAIAGAGAGIVTSIAGCPLDVIKTKLQAQQFAHSSIAYKGAVATIKQVWVRDSFKGFYRGLGPMLLGYLPTWAIYFTVYDSVKEAFGGHALGGRHVDCKLYIVKLLIYFLYASAQGHPVQEASTPLYLQVLSAMIAGGASTVATSPLWVIKTRFMTQPPGELRYRHTLDAFITVHRAEGWRAFYRGLLTSLLGTSHVAVQFPLYEYLRHVSELHTDDGELSTSQIVACSAVAKTVASVTTYPHEVIRTRLQVQKSFKGPSPIPGSPQPAPRYTGILQTAALITQEEGWRGLYKGLSINLIRAVPSSAVTLLTYELIMRYLDEHRSRGHNPDS